MLRGQVLAKYWEHCRHSDVYRALSQHFHADLRSLCRCASCLQLERRCLRCLSRQEWIPQNGQFSSRGPTETWGAGVPWKDFLYQVKKWRNKNSRLTNVCFSITGTRFPYYISLITVWFARRTSICWYKSTKNGFKKVKIGVWSQDIDHARPRPYMRRK